MSEQLQEENNQLKQQVNDLIFTAAAKEAGCFSPANTLKEFQNNLSVTDDGLMLQLEGSEPMKIAEAFEFMKANPSLYANQFRSNIKGATPPAGPPVAPPAEGKALTYQEYKAQRNQTRAY